MESKNSRKQVKKQEYVIDDKNFTIAKEYKVSNKKLIWWSFLMFLLAGLTIIIGYSLENVEGYELSEILIRAVVYGIVASIACYILMFYLYRHVKAIEGNCPYCNEKVMSFNKESNICVKCHNTIAIVNNNEYHKIK